MVRINDLCKIGLAIVVRPKWLLIYVVACMFDRSNRSETMSDLLRQCLWIPLRGVVL